MQSEFDLKPQHPEVFAAEPMHVDYEELVVRCHAPRSPRKLNKYEFPDEVRRRATRT